MKEHKEIGWIWELSDKGVMPGVLGGREKTLGISFEPQQESYGPQHSSFPENGPKVATHLDQ